MIVPVMTDASGNQLSDPPPPGERGLSSQADLLGRLRFFFEYRHSEPLARLRARSIVAQLRAESGRRR